MSDQEAILAGLRGQALPITVDVPLAYRFDAAKKSLVLEASSNPVLGQQSMVVRLELTPAATEAILRLADEIRASPGTDIAGSSREPNMQ